MRTCISGLIHVASVKDPEAPNKLNLFETTMYYGMEKPANWFRRKFERSPMGKYVKITSPSRKGKPPVRKGLRALTDSKYATAGGGNGER